VPVAVHNVRSRARRETFVNHYLSGIFSACEQPAFHWYAGAEQTAKITELLDRSPDLVLVHQLAGMLPLLRSRRRPVRMFFDLDNIEHRLHVQAVLKLPFRLGKLGYLSHLPALAAAERAGAARSRLTFVCSEVDRSRLARLGFRRVVVVPNAVRAPPKPPPLPKEPTVLFMGMCRYDPNIEAAERLVRRIFPRVRALIPDAQLLIAGQGSLDLPSRQCNPEGVRYLGFVDDLLELYASSRVICCPMMSGSGTRLKLIEAAGYARPIVSTRIGSEGLDFRDESEILLREDDDDIAEACAQLLRDDARCRSLGTAARERVREKYDETAIRRTIVRLMSGAERNSLWIRRAADRGS